MGNHSYFNLFANASGQTLIVPFPLDGGPELLDRQLYHLNRFPPDATLQQAWSAAGNRGICPQFYLAEMKYRWAVDLGSIVTPKLQALWVAMCETFNKLLSAKPGDPWQVIAPETGTGKSQGSCLYAALLALHTTEGMLFVTRLISQCDEAVETIHEVALSHYGRYNLTPREGLAVAYHSEQKAHEKPSFEQIQGTPCLVISHSMLTNVYEQAAEHGEVQSGFLSERFKAFVEWREGRRLRVTDETPSGMVRDYSLVSHNMKKYLAPFMSPSLDLEETKAIMAIQEAWSLYEDDQGEEDGSKLFEHTLHDYLTTPPDKFTLRNHFEAVRAARRPWRMSKAQFLDDQTNALETLQAIQHVLNSWSVFLRQKGECFLTSAKLITPPDEIPMVVLDATAATSPYWRVFHKPMNRVKVPEAIRDYSNVTFHACFQGGGYGKGNITKTGKKRVAEMLAHFENEHKVTGHKRKVLLVIHKDAEVYIPHRKLTGGSLEFITPSFMDSLQVAHWGAIDGRNDYQSCDTVVIISTLIPPDHFGINLLFSNTKPENRTDDLLQASTETIRDLKFGETMVAVIQAINRVRCRRVVDDAGGCDPTDIFMVLPKANDKFSKDLVSSLQGEMQGMKFTRWNISIDGVLKTGVRKDSFGDRLVKHLRKLAPGEYPLGELMDKLKVSKSGRKEMRKDLNNGDSSLSQSLGNLGWRYEVRRVGQRDQALMVKL